MRIPRRGLERFVRDVADQCLISQVERTNRGAMFSNYALTGSENASDAAMFNKTFAYLDDLESLLYSPVSLRFHISDPDNPNVLGDAKGKAAAAKLRQMARTSDTDTMISEAVFWSLVKGKALVKQTIKRGAFSPALVQPEAFGVFNENHTKLDEDMEAFTHSMLITPYQFRRLIWNHPDRDKLEKKAKRYQRESRGGLSPANGASKQVIVGGLYPFQAAGSTTPNNTRGIVDWMGGPSPMLSPSILQSLMQLDEVWVWDDEAQDWATFQIIGNDMLIFGGLFIANAFAWDPQARQSVPNLKGHHPFSDISPNRIDGYFWGRSEVINVALLQEAINSRLSGINRLLRMEEDPPKRFIGGSGVNQAALSRFSKPGGYWVDGNPNAKVENMPVEIKGDLWASLHEYERMMDEVGGLPPTGRGHGEAGVRSQAHAETLVRMFSPRFKDRALLVERDVEGIGGMMLELAKAHVDKKLTAWVPEAAAGLEKPPLPDPLTVAPVKGDVAVRFSFADLSEDVVLSVDSHSSSPAFSEESKSLLFNLVKAGAAGPGDLLDHTDAPDPEELAAGLRRRQAAVAESKAQEAQLKLVGKSK